MPMLEQDYAKLMRWAKDKPYQVLSIRWHNHPKTKANWNK